MSVLERLDSLAKHYDERWRTAGRHLIDNETREALEDAAKMIRASENKECSRCGLTV